MKRETIYIGTIPAILWGKPAEKLYLFIHGQGGSKEGADTFSELACPLGCQVLSIDLPGHGARNQERGFDPWHAVPELRQVMAWAKARFSSIALRADSIGAYFSMLAFPDDALTRCLFVSPILDMNRLIETMMQWAGVTAEQLEREGSIPTTFGQTLSWDYLLYAKRHPIERWGHDTRILYASNDNLTPLETVKAFNSRFSCELSVIEDGEHWFHTPSQLEVLERWTKENLMD